MEAIVPRTRAWKSTYALVVISPAMTTRPVAVRVSQATRLDGSSARQASRTASEIWSAILSGWPSVTDSDVKRYGFRDANSVLLQRPWNLTPGGMEKDSLEHKGHEMNMLRSNTSYQRTPFSAMDFEVTAGGLQRNESYLGWMGKWRW